MYNAYQINILINGKIATKYDHNGDTYIEGRKGSEYELELINNSWDDAEFIVSIDGLSIIDGSAAGSNSSGYIVHARSRTRIKGWLLDSTKAASFKFGEKESSYAAQSNEGNINNTGVIGLLVFPRKREAKQTCDINHVLYDYSYLNFRNSLNPSSCNLSNSLTGAFASSVGTEFGKAVDFSTHRVNFERDSQLPAAQFVIYYGDANDLNRLGIVLDWQKKPQTRPDPFPADSSYCTPPANWKR